MARTREDIPLIENAIAGQVAIIRPAVGRTLLEMHIEHGGLTLAQMTDIKIQLVSPTRTVTLQEFKDGVELDNMNKRYNRHTEDGTLSLYFRRPEMQSEAERMATALGTGGLQQVKVTFKIAAATVPVITSWGRFTANRHVSAGLLTYIVDGGSPANEGGNNHHDVIDRRDRIAAVHVLHDTLSDLELRVDGATAYELSRARAEFDEKTSAAGRTPYDAAYGMCIDFLLSGVLDESLLMSDGKGYQVQAMRLTSTVGAGGVAQIRYLTEYLSTWASINGKAA